MPFIKDTEFYETPLFKVWDYQANRWLNNAEMKDVLELKFEYARAWVEVKDIDRYEIIKPKNNYFHMPDDDTEIMINCQDCGVETPPEEMCIDLEGTIVCTDCSADNYDPDELVEYLKTGY